MLGWTRKSWDAEFGEFQPPSANADWDELSQGQQEAAKDLEYDEQLWNQDEGEVWRHQDLSWDSLPDAHRLAWSYLGWTRMSWSARAQGAAHTTPRAMLSTWSGLSLEQREAAARLGFYPSSWNQSRRSIVMRWLQAYRGRLTLAATCLVCVLYMLRDRSGRIAKDRFDKQEDQVTAVQLRRVTMKARENWQQLCEEVGFLFHSAAGIKWGGDSLMSFALEDSYWCETGAYLLSAEGKQELDRATWELHSMCLQAVEEVVRDPELMDVFQVPHRLRGAIRASWDARQPDLIGRFDLLYDGSGPAKLLEYNADTPTLLLESSVVQDKWRSDRQDSFQQFNDIDSALIRAWPTFLGRATSACGSSDKNPKVYFAAQRASLEERCNIDYLASTARKAGVSVEVADIENIIFGEDGRLHHSGNGENVTALWKLYPYEWLAEEELGAALEGGANALWFEPPWKSILSNKSILALLWRMFPEHPNLLPAFFTAQEAEEYQSKQVVNTEDWGWVAKPRYGREGIGIRYSFDSPSLRWFEEEVCSELRQLESFGEAGAYQPQLMKQVEQLGKSVFGEFGPGLGKHNLLADRQEELHQKGKVDLRAELPFPPLGGPVFQLYQDTATFAGRRPVVGSWVVFGNPAGVCFREDIQRTTDNDSCFTPHLIDTMSPKDLIVSGDPRLDGTYTLSGQLGEKGIYSCKEKKTYLLQNSEKNWMFTDQEGGGYDGLQGIAVSTDQTLFPNSIRSHSWDVLSTYGDFVPANLKITQVPQADLPKLRPLSEGQRALRSGLYGAAETLAAAPGASNFHRDEAGGHHHGYYGNRPFSSQPGQQPSSQHAKQEKDSGQKHGRKSAATSAWRQYGKGERAKTGSYGTRSCSTQRSSGSGGS
eukprot:TRINITY_DN40038_c0_g1_i1.p1 TRINITY_DN40038_c0_g1~~TRINITY_DN40038_c0_g1_i1.p1  ORF type:complete len:973 (+),score=194.01 TRINITY_DN40038_c0_g1_i1:283-2919(+)